MNVRHKNQSKKKDLLKVHFNAGITIYKYSQLIIGFGLE